MPAPDFRAPSSKGHTLGPDTFEERLAVALFFLDGLDGPDDQTRAWAFDALLPEFGNRRVQLLGVVPSTARQLRDAAAELSVTLLADEDGSIRQAFGAHVESPFAVVIDRFGTVAAVLTGDECAPDALVGAVDRLLEERPDAVQVHPDTATG
jgi:peroxiredoxin